MNVNLKMTEQLLTNSEEDEKLKCNSENCSADEQDLCSGECENQQEPSTTLGSFMSIHNLGPVYASNFNKNSLDYDSIVSFAYADERGGFLLNFDGQELKQRFDGYLRDSNDTLPTEAMQNSTQGYQFSIVENDVTQDLLVVGENYGDDGIFEMSKCCDFHPLSGHTDSVCCIAWNSTGTLVAAGSMDGRVSVWDVSTGNPVHFLEGPTDSVECVKWHPKKDMIACSSSEGSVWIWDFLDGEFEFVDTFYNNGAIADLSFAPNGRYLVSVGEEGSLRVWDSHVKTFSFTIKDLHSKPINCLRIAADSNIILTGGQDHEVKVSTLQSKKVKSSLVGHVDSVEKVEFVNGFPWAVSASLDKRIGIWDLNTAKNRLWLMNGDIGVSWIQLLTNHTLISSDLAGFVKMWDIRSGELISSIRAHEDLIMEFDYLEKHKLLLTSSIDGYVKLYPFPM